MAITLPNNPAFQNVNLSAVTQAAQQSPLTSGANSNQNFVGQGGGGNPSTSLNLSGAVSQVGQNFANLGKVVGQVPIPGPSGQHGAPAGAPPYPSNTQNQTVTYNGQTFKSDGRGGWVLYTPNQPTFVPLVSGGNQITPFFPPYVPPPSPVQSASMIPTKGVSAATGPLSSVNPGAGGVAGQASPINNIASQATKGLQSATSLPLSVINSMIQSGGLSLPQGQSVSSPQAQKSTLNPQAYNPKADTGGAVDVLAPFAKSLNQTAQDIILGGGPELAKLPSDVFSGAAGLAEKLGGAVKPALAGLAGALGFGASAPANKAQGAFNPSKIGTPQALTTPTGETTNIASMQNLSGNVDPKQGIQSFLGGKSNLVDTASSIASPQALPAINKAIDAAQKAGDMATVGKLADLHTAVQQQLNFINQIGQVVTALAAGFGTPNAAGVTEARTPMIQQGIGQALTTPQAGNVSLPNQVPGSQIPYLPTNLQAVNPVQQQKPVLNSFMGR